MLVAASWPGQVATAPLPPAAAARVREEGARAPAPDLLERREQSMPAPGAGPKTAALSWSGQGCTAAQCHSGIEPIRDPDSEMFKRIIEIGRAAGDPDGCVACHGGDPRAEDVASAHRGAPARLAREGGPDAFFPDPASPWVNERTCGRCHAELVAAQWRSLMMTEAGKIQGTAWAFGSLEGYDHRWANYAVASLAERIGTPAYRAYMAAKAGAHPNVFVSSHEPLPDAPAGLGLRQLAEEPGRAAFTYIRNQCQRCHLGVRGRQARGDYRGMGCGACHVPYGNEGLYEGGDRAIPPDEPGHLLVHRIQATREATVERPAAAGAPAVRWSGIPVETCTTCHNRGKRIGVSYQGLMEAAWDTPYTEGGGGQLPLHTKHYIALSRDVHYQKGMLCQDCHTSGDVHGDGGLAGANLAAVEIECSDCHGTPARYPWELPLGWGDEDAPGAASGPPRGVARELPAHLERGTLYPQADGYLLTARGNPMPEVVRVGDRVLVHTAGGRDLWLDPLRRKADRGELSPAAEAAMVTTPRHLETMECYACHATWAPQCYGCHVKIDYSGGARSFDWVSAGRRHGTPAGRTARGENGFDTTIPGRVV
ncbi:MAG: cytochrome C, partial [Candidatus Dadabacteria bacterium]